MFYIPRIHVFEISVSVYVDLVYVDLGSFVFLECTKFAGSLLNFLIEKD